jgi:N-methylhydantoinase B
MTNTLNTPIEVIESRFPLRVESYALRKGSAGQGRRLGGEGLLRSFRFLAPTQVTLLSERRQNRPWGIGGGGPGSPGVNRHNDQLIASKVNLQMEPGDLLSIETPGGGGWGEVEYEHEM